MALHNKKPGSPAKDRPHFAAGLLVLLIICAAVFSCQDRKAEKVKEERPPLASAGPGKAMVNAPAADPVGRRLMETGNYEKAVDYYRELMSQNPGDEMACIGLGRALCVTAKTEEALSVFADCIRDHSDFSPLFVARGLCKQISKGEFTPSPEEDFQQAIKIDPSNSSAHNQLGLIYQDRGDLESAETEFRLALAYKPDFFVALNNLAAVLIRQGKYDEAIRLLQRAIALQPDLRGLYIYTNLGLAFLQSGRARRAEAAFLMETSINPQHLPAHVYLGNLYVLSGRYEEAVQEYQRVLLTDPRNKEALINQGAAFVMAGRKNLAIERLEKAVRLYPESALAHYHLAKAYQGTGQKALAEKEIQKARELGYGQ